MADNYCWSCGQKIEHAHLTCPSCGALYDGEGKFGDVPALGAGGVGWSNQDSHPSFTAYHDRKRKSFWKWIAALAIIIGGYIFVVPGHHAFDADGLKAYAAAMFIAWAVLIALYNDIGSSSGKNWEGVVSGRKVKKYTTYDKDEGGMYIEFHTSYVVLFTKDDGHKEELSLEEDSLWYDYLKEGDRVRYHGKNGMNYYEKYDKSSDETIMCAGCHSMRDARENFCGKCGCIIMKGVHEA